MGTKLKNKDVTKFIPLFFGLLIYLFLIPPMILGLGEGVFQILLLGAHAVIGLIAGIITGSDGIIGLISFTCLIIFGYLLMVLVQPDSLWIIGLIFLGFTQALYWGGWLLGCFFNKLKLLT